MGVKKRTGGPTNGRRDKAFLGVECIAVLLPIEQSNVERRWILTFVLSVPTALPTLSWLCLKLIHPILNCRPIWENPRRGNSPCLQLSLKKKKKSMCKKCFLFTAKLLSTVRVDSLSYAHTSKKRVILISGDHRQYFLDFPPNFWLSTGYY